jgi:fused signal recognition particle receptor
MDITVVLLVLIALVLIFGFGVLIVSRRRARGEAVPSGPPSRPIPPVPERRGPASSTAVEEVPEVDLGDEAELIEAGAEAGVVEPLEPLVLGRPRFRDRISKARASLTGAFVGVRGRSGITQDSWDDLEDALLRADVGVRVTDELLDGLRTRVKAKELTTPEELLGALRDEMSGRLQGADRTLHSDHRGPGLPDVWLFVGVNGVGKTTTIGKLGARQIAEGRSVLMAAGDTFRAAAAEQLATWAERAGAEFVRGNEGGDPSSVIFDGVQAAAARGCDLVLGDTAGRLHTKTNLMDELRKVRRVADREPGRVTEVLLVIDATTGQNGLAQARQFGEVTDVTGVVLTKLDGSAKGGIVFAIETELGLPIKLVGLGESIADLVDFDPDEFIDALFED